MSKYANIDMSDEKLLQIVQEQTADADTFITVRRILNSLPKEDVAPVVHAHWEIDTKVSFNDYGDCVVYCVAKCSKCHNEWHNRHNVYSQMVLDYDYEQEIETPITEERINNAKNDCKQFAEKRILEMAPFCEYCGAKMDEKEKNND